MEKSNIKRIERIDWIDQARGILFIFVVAVHTRLSPEWLRHIYIPFFLAGFFFLSGFLHKKRCFLSNLKSITNGILIPIILYSLILSGICLLQTHDYIESIKAFLKTIQGGDSIWFLPCLILVELIYLLLENISVRYAPYVAISLACMMFFIVVSGGVSRGLWCWNVACYSVGYYGIGALLKDKMLSLPQTTASFIIYIATCLILGNYGLLQIDMHLNKFSSPVTFLIMSVWGTISVISLTQYLPTQKYICEFGRYTLFLFPFHTFILRHLLKITEPLDINPYLSFLFVTLACIVIGLFLARYIYRFIPALGGKKKWIA